MTPSLEELVSLAESHWPSSIEAALRPETCPQFERLQARWRHELAHGEPWRTFLAGLQQDLPGFIVGDVTATVDASRRCAVYPSASTPPPGPDWVVIGCLSLLAPVQALYAVHRDAVVFAPLPPGPRAIAETIARRLEATFEARELPGEAARLRVPLFVDPLQPPETTLFHALFTSQPQSVP